MQFSNYLNKIKNNELLQFFLCNAIYSGSTLIFNLIFPFIFEKELFGEVVYLFQMVIFMNTITGLGLSTALLRNYNKNEEGIAFQYYLSIFIITIVLIIFGLQPGNPISLYIEVSDLTQGEHFLFYSSVIVSNLFLFNRSYLNADRMFKIMLLNVSLIFILRLLGLVIINEIGQTDLINVLLVLFVTPFLYEIYFFILKLFKLSKFYNLFSRADYIKFLQFSLKVFIVGAIFVAADRLFLIRLKAEESKFTSILSFAYGFLGIISILNMSFTNYFLGKIDPNNNVEILNFETRVRTYAWKFITFAITISIIAAILVYLIYPQLGTIAPIVLFILIIKTAAISYFGLTNLLSKTLNLLGYDIVINILRYLLILFTINMSQDWNFLITLILVSSIMILGEFALSQVIRYNILKIAL